MHKFRTHKCTDLGIKDINKTVKVSGWLHRKRNHGGVCFVDLRDHSGIIQIVTSNQEDRANNLSDQEFAEFTNISHESVITISGSVHKRSDQTVNRDIKTGNIEIVVESFTVESLSDPLPINMHAVQPVSEELRLKYRFLDLRRNHMRQNILLRSNVIKFLRHVMHEEGFTEFQTPILTAPSPEGARDFIVPSRLHSGHFYALPQAPQQFKQILMASGFDKYFQIAPCFRDEDARSDRAPGEFYQLDMEMSFVEQEDVLQTIEPILYNTFKKFSTWNISKKPFPRITYLEAMLKYGSDKPDLRNPIVMSDVTEVFSHSEFAIFSGAIKRGCRVRAIPVNNIPDLSRSFYDKMIAFAQNELQAKGLAYIIFDKDGVARGPIAKFLNNIQLDKLKHTCSLKSGDSVFFICDFLKKTNELAGKIRNKLAKELDILEKNTYNFCWVTDYPLYEWNCEEKKLDFFHNPFSKPQGGLEVLNSADTNEKKLSIKAFQYDIVCNGIELSSGAIRSHHLPTLYKAFAHVGYSKKQVDANFNAIVTALRFGAPPHGGIAPGIDRIVMMLANTPNIREIIAFPLNQHAQDLLMKAPSPIQEQVLNDLNLNVANKDT